MLTQPDIFGVAQADPRFAELSVALYEREIRAIALACDLSESQLRRRLTSLPFYISRAALALLSCSEQQSIAVSLDHQNAGWLGKQASQPPANKSPEETTRWFTQHAALALPVPVLQHDQLGLTQMRLDTIDQIDTQEQRIHLNRWGWYSFSGAPHHEKNSVLLKPSKSVMVAACAGHRWDAKGRVNPEPLLLRELLLTTTVHWPGFKKARPLTF